MKSKECLIPNVT